uniref:Uncharacterized protein n=3 Tax=Setaria TaxID=4554 RepID=K3YJP4_SETIT
MLLLTPNKIGGASRGGPSSAGRKQRPQTWHDGFCLTVQNQQESGFAGLSSSLDRRQYSDGSPGPLSHSKGRRVLSSPLRPTTSQCLSPPPSPPRRPAKPDPDPGFKLINYIATMVLDSLSSPHRRSQNTFFVSSAKKPQSSRDDSWSALVERHRFLLTTLVVLAFLCTIYLYFAVTLGASDACAGLAGAERIECQAKSLLRHGKLKFL